VPVARRKEASASAPVAPAQRSAGGAEQPSPGGVEHAPSAIAAQ